MPKPIIATYPVPAGAPQNADFEVSVNGRPIGVFANGPHTFAAFSFDRGPVDICITCLAPFTGVRIRPCAAGIAPRIKGRDIAFALAAPQKLSVEIQDGPNLFLYQAGAVFEIRTVDGARIENILFENIRIEEDHQPLIRFDMKNWYKVGDRQGHVRGVYLRDISVANGAGECVLEGADEAHGYRDIHFWQVRIDGALVGDPSPLGTMPTCVENLTFDCDLRPPPDDVPPRLLLVRAYPTSAAGETAVIFLTLSKSISRDPALDAACYRIPGSRILSVGITPGFRQIALAVEGLRKDAVLEIAGLRDLAGNALSPASPAPVVYRQAWHASGDFAEWQGACGWYYEQFNPSEVTVFATRKDITRPPGYGLMNAHIMSDGLRWVAHRSDAWISQDAQKPGDIYFPVRTWQAPASGTVRIESIGGAASSSSRFCILYNARAMPEPGDDRELWVGATPPTHPVETEVIAGALLRFAVSGPYAPVSWDLKIRYV